jgi:signal peptidase I
MMPYDCPLLFILLFATALLWPSISRAQTECTAQPVAVRGDSLSPLVADGNRVMMKPAACAGTVRRGDLVIFRTGAHEQPVIKIAKGLPGDRFGVDGDGFVIVNDAILENSVGAAYLLPAPQRSMLRAYRDDYGGAIPADTYLLLGDAANSMIDSARLGLIHMSDFIMVGSHE